NPDAGTETETGRDERESQRQIAIALIKWNLGEGRRPSPYFFRPSISLSVFRLFLQRREDLVGYFPILHYPDGCSHRKARPHECAEDSCRLLIVLRLLEALALEESPR